MTTNSRSAENEPQPVERVLREARLRHLRRSESVVVGRRVPVKEVVQKMQETHTGGALVVEPDGRLAGIFTERDYLDKLSLAETRSKLGLEPETPVERLMTASPRTLTPEHTLGDAIRLMTEGGYRHIPLVEADGRALGLFSASDAVQYIAEHFPAEVYNLPPRLHQSIRTLDGG
jgi:CBS domain-containing protein